MPTFLGLNRIAIEPLRIAVLMILPLINGCEPVVSFNYIDDSAPALANDTSTSDDSPSDTPSSTPSETPAAITNRLVFAAEPTSEYAGGVFLIQPSVQIEASNAPGVALTSESTSVTLAAYSNSSCTTAAVGTLSHSSAVATTNGVATFSGVINRSNT